MGCWNWLHRGFVVLLSGCAGNSFSFRGGQVYMTFAVMVSCD